MNWKIIIVLVIAVFSATLGNGIVVPLLPVYARTLGASASVVGLIFGAFSISRTIFLPCFGLWSDRSGRKPFIVTGLIAYIAASVSFAFADKIEMLLIIRFFQGIAAAMILPVAQAYAGEISPGNREGYILGIVNVGLYGGLSAGPVLGGLIKDHLGIKASFGVMGLIFLCGLVSSLVLLPATGNEHGKKRNSIEVKYRDLIFNRYISGLFIFRTAYTMCMGSIWAFTPIIAASRFNMNALSIGLIISISVLVSALMMTPMGIVADKTRKVPLIIAGGVLTTASMLYLIRIQHPWELYIVSCLIGIGGGFSVPSIMAMTVIAGKHFGAMGTLISLLTMSHSLGLILGPILTGLVIDVMEMEIAFMAGAVFMCAATVLVVPLTAGFTSFSIIAEGTTVVKPPLIME